MKDKQQKSRPGPEPEADAGQVSPEVQALVAGQEEPPEAEEPVPDGEVIEAVERIDAMDWINASTEVLGQVMVTVNGKKRALSIAALTDPENHALMEASKKRDPKNPKKAPKVSSLVYRQMMVAASLNKAARLEGRDLLVLTPAQVGSRLAGELSMVQTKIMELSGFDLKIDQEDAEAFFA